MVLLYKRMRNINHLVFNLILRIFTVVLYNSNTFDEFSCKVHVFFGSLIISLFYTYLDIEMYRNDKREYCTRIFFK